jgi:hypothetical protein
MEIGMGKLMFNRITFSVLTVLGLFYASWELSERQEQRMDRNSRPPMSGRPGELPASWGALELPLMELMEKERSTRTQEKSRGSVGTFPAQSLE